MTQGNEVGGGGGVADLVSSDLLTRLRAQERFLSRGEAAVGQLTGALNDPNPDLRWEAAKLLRDIAHESAVPALIGALEDESGTVRWLAAEALQQIGKASLIPLLRGLLSRSDSVWLLEGVHRVCRGLNAEGDLTPVVHAIEGRFAHIAVLPAVDEVLRKLEAS